MEEIEAVVERFLRSLTNITPTPEQVVRIAELRGIAKVFGETVLRTTVSSRERSLAITHLEDSVMWAVKGVLLNG